jgi:hypothetical protein
MASRLGSTPVQERTGAFERADDGRARLALVRLAEELRRVLDADEPFGRHLEHAELVRRAEAVLDGAQHAVGAIAVAFEVEDAVDEMLEDTRPRHRSFLRHVPHEEEGDVVLLTHAEETRGRFAHLRD